MEGKADVERAFDAERSETVRTRARWILGAATIVWALTLVGFDSTVFGSRRAALLVRIPETLVAIASLVYLRKPRSLRGAQGCILLTWTGFAGASAYGLLLVPADKLPVKVASLALSVLVVSLLMAITWEAATIAFLVTVAALSTLHFRGADTLFMLTMTVVGFAYIVLIASAAARDRLSLSAFVTRRELASANERLRHEAELRHRLFVNLSHDFKTPLAVVRGEAALLRRAGAPKEDDAALARIESNARSLADLAEQLLDLARLEAGQMPVRPRSCDAVRLAREVVASLDAPTKPRCAVVAQGAVVALVDPGHLRRVLTNLIANGLSHAKGDVVVTLRNDGERIVVDVANEGEPIPEDRRAAIFERFVTFAADGNTASGIGLPLARELAEHNHGSLALVAGVERTTFRLTLPASSEPPEDLEFTLDAAPSHIAGDAMALSRPRIGAATNRAVVLVVEDNLDMASLLCRVLDTAFVTEHAATLASAVDLLAKNTYGAIVSDVMLGDGTGYDVLAAVRKRADLEALPVLFVSALGEVSERVRGLTAGADDYLAKPFAPEELLSRVGVLLDRAEKRKRALDAQRDALLMEIHDGVSASLSRAAMLLSASEDPVQSATRASEAIRDGLDEVRAIGRLLSPRPTTWTALVAEIRREMADSCKVSSLALQFDEGAATESASASVPAAVAHTLRRIAREATTNAIKHARATSITCHLSMTAKGYGLRIEDDGCGFSGRTDGGQGLGIMRRRVTRLGGSLEIVDRRESDARTDGPTGVSVVVTLPRDG